MQLTFDEVNEVSAGGVLGQGRDPTLGQLMTLLAQGTV